MIRLHDDPIAMREVDGVSFRGVGLWELLGKESKTIQMSLRVTLVLMSSPPNESLHELSCKAFQMRH